MIAFVRDCRIWLEPTQILFKWPYLNPLWRKTRHASASPARWDSPQPKVADAMRWIRRFSLFFCDFWMNQSHLDLVLVQVTKSAKRNQLFFAVLFFFFNLKMKILEIKLMLRFKSIRPKSWIIIWVLKPHF